MFMKLTTAALNEQQWDKPQKKNGFTGGATEIFSLPLCVPNHQINDYQSYLILFSFLSRKLFSEKFSVLIIIW